MKPALPAFLSVLFAFTALLGAAGVARAQQAGEDPSRRPILTAALDVYWGGDGLGEFGVRGTGRLRAGPLIGWGTAMAPFHRGEGLIRPDFDGYFRLDVGLTYAYRRSEIAAGNVTRRERSVVEQTPTTITYVDRNVTRWEAAHENLAGIDVGVGYAVQRTLPDGGQVKMPLVFAGVRGETQYNSPTRFSFYAHVLRAGAMEYDPLPGIEENPWGARVGSQMAFELSGRYIMSSSFEVAFEPTARVRSGWPGFRMFLSFGAGLAF